ncbi:MAG TPA: hypothetical protein DCM86_18830 [Verrucomicrobiales bacterium]|nr:hypothetical protein [Verrucomicrobiales bacterium]
MGGLPEAEARYRAARVAWETNRFDLERSSTLAETCFDRAEFCSADKERSALAEEGISASREVVRRSSNNVAGHFFLAMNLGQLARTRVFTALGLVSEMERHFLAAVALDPGFRDAGPERSLGMLYAQAPGWPTSIGSKSKARQHLQRAVDLAPDFPENLLSLLEAEMGFGDRRRVATRIPELDKTLARGRSLPALASRVEEWKEWESRAAALRKYADTAPPASGRRKASGE